jgi:bacterioferritin (cytochrome b1)
MAYGTIPYRVAHAMHVESFLAELDQRIASALADLEGRAVASEPGPDVGIPELLRVALKKELEASEEAALWMTREADVDVKLSLARQCGDEAKHYRLIEKRLGELGAPSLLPPSPPTPMFSFLAELGTTVERVAAGQFTREALAQVHNRVFIEYCETRGDSATAALYRDIIQPDEAHHHAMGRTLLERLAVSEETQTLARAASLRTLAIAGELQETARLKRGIARAPGC